MRAFRVLLLGSLSAALMMVAASAQAAYVSDLDVISAKDIGSGTLGTVTLTQNGPDEVDLEVALSSGTDFVDTGGPHTAFVFNLDASVLSTGYTVSVTAPSGDTFTVSGPNPSDTPYGTFTNGVDCPGCGPGASDANPGPLDLKIVDDVGVTISDFVQNSPGGYFFAADVIGPGLGTGAIASTVLAKVAEPGSLPLLLGVLIGFALWRRRRSKTRPVFDPTAF